MNCCCGELHPAATRLGGVRPQRSSRLIIVSGLPPSRHRHPRRVSDKPAGQALVVSVLPPSVAIAAASAISIAESASARRRGVVAAKKIRQCENESRGAKK